MRLLCFLAAALLAPLPAAAQDDPSSIVVTRDGADIPPPPIVRLAEAAPRTELLTDQPGPRLWKIGDTDTTIYLFGTVHVLPDGFVWRTPAINAAIDASDELVIEAQAPDNPFAISAAFAQVAFSRANPPLRARLDERLHPLIDAMVEDQDLPESFFDKLDSWAVATWIWEMEDEAVDWGPGTEAQLETQFRDAGKPMDTLEKFSFQVGLFDRLDLDLQHFMLADTLEDRYGSDEAAASSKEQFDTLLANWIAGNPLDIGAEMLEYDLTQEDLEEAGLAKRFGEQFFDLLLTQRNRNWIEWLKDRLEAPGTVFVAVGAGHMAGDQSVIAMLEAEDIEVIRLQ